MIDSCARICSLAAILSFSGNAFPQNVDTAHSVSVVIEAFDGRYGKPLADQRLFVFMGQEAVIGHAMHTQLTTDKNGSGTLTVRYPEVQWIQVWADGDVLCESEQNPESFSIAAIRSKGRAAPNNCSAFVRHAAPGHLIIHARPKNIAEKMRE
jgi:hypothetical protein